MTNAQANASFPISHSSNTLTLGMVFSEWSDANHVLVDTIALQVDFDDVTKVVRYWSRKCDKSDLVTMLKEAFANNLHITKPNFFSQIALGYFGQTQTYSTIRIGNCWDISAALMKVISNKSLSRCLARPYLISNPDEIISIVDRIALQKDNLTYDDYCTFISSDKDIPITGGPRQSGNFALKSLNEITNSPTVRLSGQWYK